MLNQNKFVVILENLVLADMLNIHFQYCKYKIKYHLRHMCRLPKNKNKTCMLVVYTFYSVVCVSPTFDHLTANQVNSKFIYIIHSKLVLSCIGVRGQLIYTEIYVFPFSNGFFFNILTPKIILFLLISGKS